MTQQNLEQRAHEKEYSLRPNQCFDYVLDQMTKYVPIESQGKNGVKQLHSTFIGMSATKSSCHSIQRCVEKIPSEGSIKHHLKKLSLEDMEHINHILLTDLFSEILSKDKEYEFSIDFTDDPYYGVTTSENKDYIVGGQCKKSTKKFYRYATLYLVMGELKITIAVLPVKKKTIALDYVRYFIDIIEDLQLKVKVLLLDRGFYAVKIFKYLIEKKIPHIVPVKKKSKKMKQFLTQKESRNESYTVSSPKNGKVDVKIAIACKYSKGKRGCHGKITLGYVVFGIDWHPHKIFKVYRRRFAIEASYRMRNIVRPRTSSKNPTFRYLLAIISLLIKNVWVYLKYLFFSKRQRGPRVVDNDKFRFNRFIQAIKYAFHKRAKEIIVIQTLRQCR